MADLADVAGQMAQLWSEFHVGSREEALVEGPPIRVEF
jgi:hypothetical protein